jgi:hypothetical protein
MRRNCDAPHPLEMRLMRSWRAAPAYGVDEKRATIGRHFFFEADSAG